MKPVMSQQLLVKMGKIKIIIFGFVILLFISGCNLGGESRGPAITNKDIYTGKEGLIFDFFENAPPEDIFERSILPIGLRLYNNGAYDIQEGYLSISLEKEYMFLDEASLKSINDGVNFRDAEHITFDLKGKSIERPKGGQEVITFNSETKDLSITDPQSEYHDSLISITTCYKYQTKMTETLCIDTDIYGFKHREKACEVKTINLNSQGAPVAVTKIESEMLPGKDDTSLVNPRFIITVRNVGNGEVVKESLVEAACTSKPIKYDEWGNINIKAYISVIDDEHKLDCDVVKEGTNDDGTLILKRNEDSIRCTYEKGFKEEEGVFSSPLYILLDYGYTDTISREIRIKSILTS